jgi:hypothetical protein
MDFQSADKERERLLAQLASGQITRETCSAAISALRVADAQGRWWQPSPSGSGWLVWNGTAWLPSVPPSGTGGLQPGTAKDFNEFRSRLMTVDDFRKMSKEVPITKRPQKWWDLLSILGGIVSAGIWLLYSGIREGFDILTPVLMVAIPVILVWFRADIDQMLLPLQPYRQNFPKLLLVGIGIAFPFLTSFVLYTLGIREYSLIQTNMIIGTFGAYAITRTPATGMPGTGTAPPAGRPPAPASAGALVLFLAAIGSFLIQPVRADDCTRDILNAQDCLRTDGFAVAISGGFSTILSVFVNGPTILQTLLAGGAGVQPPVPPRPPLPAEPPETLVQPLPPPVTEPVPPEIPDEGPYDVTPEEQAGIDEALRQMHAEKLRQQAEEAAREQAREAARQKMWDNLNRMEDGAALRDTFSSDDFNRFSDQIHKVRMQLIKNQNVDTDMYSSIYRVYEGRVTGRTIPESMIPSEAQVFREGLAGGIEGTAREVVTGQDADGNLSKKSLVLRGIVDFATGSASEMVYTPAAAVYTMKDYVDKGGDSILGAFGTAMTEVLKGELFGRGIGLLGKFGGKMFTKVADIIPASVTTPLREGFERLTSPIREGFEKLKDVLDTEIKNPFASVETPAPAGLSGHRIPPKTDAQLLDEIDKVKATGEPHPGLKDAKFDAADLPPDLAGMTVKDQKVVRMVADKHGVEIHMRPTNPDAEKWISSGKAHPKPEALKAKTIDADDVHLGYDENSKGLVACKEPKPPNPADIPPDRLAKVNERYEQRLQEFKDQSEHFRQMEAEGKITWDKDTGIITDAKTGKPFAGDNDMFAVTDAATGKPVSPFTQRQVLKDLEANGTIVHPDHVSFDYSKLPDTPPAGGAQPLVPGAPQSEFSKAAGIDTKILNGHTQGVAGAKPLNTYNPLNGNWGTSWYKGPAQRSFVEAVKVTENNVEKVIGYIRKGAGGS